jgi:hypothetical protein
MCRGLGPDRALSLSYPLYDDTDLIFAQRFFGFFVAVVDQNFFPNSPEVYNHWGQCCVPVWGSCTDSHCNKVVLRLHIALDFFIVSLACRSAKPSTY